MAKGHSCAFNQKVWTRATLPAWSRRRRRRLRRAVVLLAAMAMVMPVPWMAPHRTGFGMAWQLDGRLSVNGETIDPLGRWTWLTAGRPPLVAEVVFLGAGRNHRSESPAGSRPVVNEPLAAAVGLNEAGLSMNFGVIVEAFGADDPSYPDPTRIVEFGGVPLDDLAAWNQAARLELANAEFRTGDGSFHLSSGPGLPYRRVTISETASEDVIAAVGGKIASIPPVRWIRDLALGRSHGLIVALTTYAHATGSDMGSGLHIAATGGVRSDGTVTRVGAIPTKAGAARRVGVDVFFYPADQAEELAGFEPAGMELVPVANLADAIAHLEAPP